MITRAWGKTDHLLHIITPSGSWCAAETFTQGDPPAAYPPNFEELGLACQQCKELDALHGGPEGRAARESWDSLTAPITRLIERFAAWLAGQREARCS